MQEGMGGKINGGKGLREEREMHGRTLSSP